MIHIYLFHDLVFYPYLFHRAAPPSSNGSLDFTGYSNLVEGQTKRIEVLVILVATFVDR